jgi:putative redox protein
MAMEIRFPGGMAVDARYQGFHIRTDQQVAHGGAGAAPSPFDLFLASIGTCAGYYALRFCQERRLPTDGLGLSLDFERGGDGKSIATVRIEVTVPEEFPDKYHAAITRAIDQCTVKRHLEAPPRFETSIHARPVLERSA